MFLIYRFLTAAFGLPLAKIVLSRNPRTAPMLGARLAIEGLPANLPQGKRILLNAASVGETMAVQPFAKAWREKRPEDCLLLTSTTLTGYERAGQALGDDVAWHGFSPLDIPSAVERHIGALSPDVFITVEAEAWPNHLLALGKRGVPRVLINGRMTLANKRGLKKCITGKIWRLFDLVIARSEKDFDAFKALGVPKDKLHVGGELKCDIAFPKLTADEIASLKSAFGLEESKTWVAASTHEREEELALCVHKSIVANSPDAKLVLVPRRPERFAEVEAMLSKNGLTFRKFSQERSSGGESVILVDAMGKLTDFYQAAGLAVVFGSLYGPGVHSVLEPASYGKPIIVGPRTFNTDIPGRMAGENALVALASPAELEAAVSFWIGGGKDEKTGLGFGEIGKNALKFYEENSGSVRRTLEIVTGKLGL